MFPVPRIGSEVTKEWLQSVLQEYERKMAPHCTLSIEEFNVQKGSVAGDSFNSDLSLVDVTAKLKIDEESQEQEKEYHLYMKFHSLNAFVREVHMNNKSHIREVLLYSDIYSKLTLLQETEANGMYPLGIPNLYFSYAKQNDYALVLDNLKARGYTVPDKRKGLSFVHLELALKHLARWHALSYALNKKTNFLKLYPQFKVSKKHIKFMSSILEAGITNLVPLLEQGDQYEEMLPKLKNPSALMREFVNQILNKDQNKVRCLLHGDFWNNNLLYKYDESSLPCDVKLIDWQMSYWGRPVIDLHYLMYSSTTYAVRQNHFNHLLKLYHDTFHEITVALNCQHPDYTLEAFKKEFMEASVLGFVFGITLAQGTLGKTSEKIYINQTVSPRSLAFNIKCWLTKAVIPCISQPYMNFLIKVMGKKMLGPVGKEIQDGQNKILNERLLGLIVEADQRGYLNSLN